MFEVPRSFARATSYFVNITLYEVPSYEDRVTLNSPTWLFYHTQFKATLLQFREGIYGLKPVMSF